MGFLCGQERRLGSWDRGPGISEGRPKFIGPVGLVEGPESFGFCVFLGFRVLGFSVFSVLAFFRV